MNLTPDEAVEFEECKDKDLKKHVEISNREVFEVLRINTISIKKNVFVVDVNQYLREDFPKFITCIIKSFDSAAFFSKRMTNQDNDRRDDNCSKADCDYFPNPHLLIALFLAFVLAHGNPLVMAISLLAEKDNIEITGIFKWKNRKGRELFPLPFKVGSLVIRRNNYQYQAPIVRVQKKRPSQKDV